MSRGKSCNVQSAPKVFVHREYQFKIEIPYNVLNITVFESLAQVVECVATCSDAKAAILLALITQ